MRLKNLNDILLKANVTDLEMDLVNSAFLAAFKACEIPYVIKWVSNTDCHLERDGLVIPIEDLRIEDSQLLLCRDGHMIASIPLKGEEPGRKIEIWQLKDDVDELRFMSLQEIGGKKAVKKQNYNLVYSYLEPENVSLEDIYEKFNVSIPGDYIGHSLSVSDIIVLKENGDVQAWYVDSAGFKRIEKW